MRNPEISLHHPYNHCVPVLKFETIVPFWVSDVRTSYGEYVQSYKLRPKYPVCATYIPRMDISSGTTSGIKTECSAIAVRPVVPSVAA